jgi:mono/diheme cytochrome c family protein
MQSRPLQALALLLFSVALAAEPIPEAASEQAAPGVPSEDLSPERLEYGAYLTLAGGCLACHTGEGGKPFAGGRPFETPFGVVRSANITPAADAGIGDYSDADFLQAMQRGVLPSGEPMYPVCPYPSYAKVGDDALLAIKDYLFAQPAVAEHVPIAKLAWPMDVRGRLYGWQEKFFDGERLDPDPGREEAWTRGAMLDEGLGHCSACHIDDTLAAEPGAGWFLAQPAPALAGLGEGREKADLQESLAAGLRRADPNGEVGSVEDLVHGGVARLAMADHAAIATYLADLPVAAPPESDTPSGGGAQLYARYCSACHQDYGQGQPPYFPPLRDHPSVTSADPTALIESILLGAPKDPAEAYSQHGVMPSFGAVLTDKQVADLATYVRTAWGDVADAVTVEEVGATRVQSP